MAPVAAHLEPEVGEHRSEPVGDRHHDIDVVGHKRVVLGPEVDGHAAEHDRVDSQRRRDLLDNRDDFERALGEIFDLRRVGERGTQLSQVRVNLVAHATNLLFDPADSEITSPTIVATGYDLRPVGCTFRKPCESGAFAFPRSTAAVASALRAPRIAA